MLRNNAIVLAALSALALGTASAALANDKAEYPGGYRIGPFGQRLGPVRGPAFAFVPRWHRYWYHDRDFAYMPGHRRFWHHEY